MSIMNFSANCLYHVYNHENDKKKIFFEEKNYHYFINKLRNSTSGHCDILAYCLMPNHFHILIYLSEESDGLKNMANQNQQILVRKIGTVLSSHSQVINKQESKSGSLFQQKTKSKQLTSASYATTCFHYIHQNPLRAKLVENMEDWEFSSFNDFLSNKSSVCNLTVARELLDISENPEQFFKDSYKVIDQGIIEDLL